jgi:hypothetical protein
MAVIFSDLYRDAVTQPMITKKKYDVRMSFASEQRAFVEDVARELGSRGDQL